MSLSAPTSCPRNLVQPQQYEQGQAQQYQAVPQYGPPPSAAPAKQGSFWSNIPPLVYIGVGASPSTPASLWLCVCSTTAWQPVVARQCGQPWLL